MAAAQGGEGGGVGFSLGSDGDFVEGKAGEGMGGRRWRRPLGRVHVSCVNG
jgi:hypothetical protein